MGAITNILLHNAEVTEPAEGLRTEDQLQNHLEEYCLNRTQKDSDKEDLKKGGVWTNNGYHHFVFDKFYHNF